MTAKEKEYVDPFNFTFQNAVLVFNESFIIY